MDWIEYKEKMADYFQKYKYVCIVVLIGISLMLLPERKNEIQMEENTVSSDITSLQNSLEEILTKIDGAGKVSVLLTEYTGEETIYHMDESLSKSTENSDIRKETVILTDEDRKETGLIKKVISPIYQGAIIVCQGADKATVCLSVVEAVSKVTGLSSNQISVLKMK